MASVWGVAWVDNWHWWGVLVVGRLHLRGCAGLVDSGFAQTVTGANPVEEIVVEATRLDTALGRVPSAVTVVGTSISNERVW